MPNGLVNQQSQNTKRKMQVKMLQKLTTSSNFCHRQTVWNLQS